MTLDMNIDPANEEVVQAAVEAYRQGRFLAAVDGLRILAKSNADSPQAHYYLAMALEHGNGRHHAECYEHFDRALELQPGWFDALFNYGRALLHSSRERQAEALLRQALIERPDHPVAQEFLAMSLIEQTRFDEALPYLEQAVLLMPEKDKLRQERDRIRNRVKDGTKKSGIARFPRSAAEFDDVSRVVDEYILSELRDSPPFLFPESKVFTIGSCFAANIAVALRQFGVIARDISQAEEINNTYANRYLAEWVAYGESEQTKGFAASFGEDHRKRIASLLETSDVFILSLGVAPCFFDRQTGAYVPTHGTRLHTSFLIKDCDFRTTSVGENVDNLNRIVEIVRTINPRIKIVLTVSPVPLKATFERRSSIIADCISKSTLRVAAHEFVSSEAGVDVIYWPSFEIIRWLSGHVGRMFGTDDGSPFHPDQAVIEMIMSKFVTTFGDSRLRMSRSA